MRHGKTHQPRFRPRATTHGTLVANFTTRTRAGTRKRRDRGRMVVGFHLHQQVDRLLVIPVLATLGVGKPATRGMALDHRCVVGISRKHPLAACAIGVANHAKQRVLAIGPIDRPTGVKDFMATVL